MLQYVNMLKNRNVMKGKRMSEELERLKEENNRYRLVLQELLERDPYSWFRDKIREVLKDAD